MNATIISDAGRIVRVIITDHPMPAEEVTRLVRGGLTVSDCSSVYVRARSSTEVANTVTPLLQRSLFA
jgi:hypothetical protein